MAITLAGNRPRVLVVDDEPAIRTALEMVLSRRGYDVAFAHDGEEALNLVEADRPDVVLLDVQLPRMDGLTACRRLRSLGNEVPVLILTARDTIGDRVTGLETGADDYLAKPFAIDELVARVAALLRRAGYETERRPTVLTFADLRMDTTTRQATRARRDLRLTRTEFGLLELFLARPRQVLDRPWLISALWGRQDVPTPNALDVYVMYVRRKTEADGLPRLLHTVRGTGYVLDTDSCRDTAGAASSDRNHRRPGQPNQALLAPSPPGFVPPPSLPVTGAPRNPGPGAGFAASAPGHLPAVAEGD